MKKSNIFFIIQISRGSSVYFSMEKDIDDEEKPTAFHAQKTGGGGHCPFCSGCKRPDFAK